MRLDGLSPAMHLGIKDTKLRYFSCVSRRRATAELCQGRDELGHMMSTLNIDPFEIISTRTEVANKQKKNIQHCVIISLIVTLFGLECNKCVRFIVRTKEYSFQIFVQPLLNIHQEIRVRLLAYLTHKH